MPDLDHVLWIGGPSGAGKTTVAGRLARRWGLRLYSTDTRTWAHRDRAIAAGIEAAIRFETFTHEERVQLSPEERRAVDLVAERPAMVADDLRRLPSHPLVIAEGTTLPLELAHPGRSVWLVPTEDFQFRHREGTPLGNHPIDTVAAGAQARGIAVVVVDGQRPVADIVDEVERILAGSLAAGPVAGSTQERQALLREANLAVVEQTRSGCARPWATNDPETQVRTFLCECGETGCDVEVELPVAVAGSRPVIARRHENGE